MENNKKFIIHWLRFQLCDIHKNLHRVRNRLLILDKVKTGVFEGYEIFQIKLLFELLLSAQYEEKISYKKGEFCQNMNSIYKEINQNCKMETNRTNINFFKILSYKNFHYKFCKKILKILELRSDLLNYTMTTKNYKSSKIFNFNKKILLNKKKLIFFWNKFHKDIEKIPTYIIATLISYKNNIEHDFDTSKKLFEDYKKRINCLAILANSKQDEFSKENYDIYSVVIEASLDKKDYGQIIDITSDYDSYLGTRTGGVIGTDINELFPGKVFQKVHRSKMTNLEKLGEKLVGLYTTFFIQGYNGFLQRVDFLIKYNFSLEKNTSCLIWLKFSKFESRCLVLCDMDGQIISSDRKFCTMIEKHAYAVRNKGETCVIDNFKLISDEMYSDINRIGRDKIIVDDYKKKLKSSFIKSFRDLKNDVSKKGKDYEIKSDSVLYISMRGYTFKANISVENFLGEFTYFKINLIFNSKFVSNENCFTLEVDELSHSSSSESSSYDWSDKSSNFKPKQENQGSRVGGWKRMKKKKFKSIVQELETLAQKKNNEKYSKNSDQKKIISKSNFFLKQKTQAKSGKI